MRNKQSKVAKFAHRLAATLLLIIGLGTLSFSPLTGIVTEFSSEQPSERISFAPEGESGTKVQNNESRKDRKGIPVTFELDEPRYVTLVINDRNGKRVRNLINDTRFEAGEHTIYWDGYDVGEKKGKKEKFDVHRHLVEPGEYRVEGLVHDDIELEYRASVQSPGTPPWKTPDRSGAWLSDHYAPISVTAVPEGSPFGKKSQLIFGAPKAESGHCIMWITEEAEKLYGGKLAGWTGPRALAAGKGDSVNQDYSAYGLVYKGENLILYGFPRGSKEYNKHQLFGKKIESDVEKAETETDLALWNGIAVYIVPNANRIELFDTRSEDKIGEKAIDRRTAGLALDESGRLYAVHGTRVVRYDDPRYKEGALGKCETLIEGLEKPTKLMIGPENRLFISDQGKDHQVKVFDSEGNHIRSIGKKGGIPFGHYDERQMAKPAETAIDSKGRLWVAEYNWAPKRISVWNPDTGEFIRAYYGPPRYGGGGRVDPRNTERVFYASNGQGIEFRREEENDRYVPHAIYWFHRKSQASCPGTAVYRNDRLYLVNTFNSGRKAKMGAEVFRYREDTGTVQLIARIGPYYFKGSVGRFLQSKMEENEKLRKKIKPVAEEEGAPFVSWSDLNLDGETQLNEVQIVNTGDRAVRQGMIFRNDLAVGTTSGVFLPPPEINENGVPIWDLEKWEEAAPMNARLGDVVPMPDGYFVYPHFDYLKSQTAFGYRNGELRWKRHGVGGYGVRMPIASYTGQLVSAQMHIGFPFTRPSGRGNYMIALNAYQGGIPVLTGDGFYVTDLLGDIRTTPRISEPEARPGMVVDDVSFGEEHFNPTIQQARDGTVYLMVGHASSNLFKVLGLDTIRRLDPWTIDVTENMLAGKRKKKIRPGELRERERSEEIEIRSSSPDVDGEASDWSGAKWMPVHPTRDMHAAVSVDEEKLYAAWRTGDPALLNNNVADGREYAFATGGGLDIKIRTRPDRKKPGSVAHIGERETAAEGDVRLFVTRARDPQNGPVRAVRFQQVGDGPGKPVHYSSPVGDVQFDAVKDVSEQVQLAQKNGFYELSVPLSVIGFEPRSGLSTLADIGVITGNGAEATGRYYWSNRATTMTSDIPTEARLMPQEWGTWRFYRGETPRAATGPDQGLVDEDGDGQVVVSLNGSESWDPDGSITRYDWRKNGNELATGSGPEVKLKTGVHEITLTVTDDKGNTGTDVKTVVVGENQVPYGGSPHSVPGRIEAENFDAGGEGEAYHDTDPENRAGEYRQESVDIGTWQTEYDVGFVAEGEWLEYTVDIEEERAYDLALRVARGTAGSGAVRLEVDGEDVSGSIEVPPTGGWQSWETVTASGLNLPAGEHVIRIVFKADGIDLNWFELK